MTEIQAPDGLVHGLLLDGQGGASELDWQLECGTGERGQEKGVRALFSIGLAHK